MKKKYILGLLFISLTITAQEIAFVLSDNTANRISPKKLSALMKKHFDKNVKILQAGDQENIETLKKFKMVFSDTDLKGIKGSVNWKNPCFYERGVHYVSNLLSR